MTSNVKIAKTTCFKIADLEGDYTSGFFNNDWHANGLVTETIKFGNSTGAVKLTIVKTLLF